jgi:thiamine pyrophosphokinase
MITKKENFKDEILSSGRAVLVGPMLTKEESKLISDGPLLLVDGGLEKASKHGILIGKSYFSVGDGDSSKLEMDELLDTDKDYSDLAYGLNFLPEKIKSIELFGFLGGRIDHQFINFGEIHKYLSKKDIQISANFSHEVLVLTKGTWNILPKNETFSLMAFDHPSIKVTGKVAYEVPKETQMGPFSSQFLSNKALGLFQVTCTGPVFLYGPGFKVSAG